MTVEDQDETPRPDSLVKHDVGWRRVVRNFPPSWFSINMGTGIVSTLLYTLPYNWTWLYWISVVIFALNVLLFIIVCVISILRYTLYPEIFRAMITHPTQSMFIGTLPMGFATIVNMLCFVCVPAWGPWARDFTWAMWITDAVISMTTALALPFLLMSRRDETPLSSMTAVWLLPIVGTVVAASSGALVAEILPNPQHALWTVIVSYVLWGIGLPLALMVMVIYLQRLTLHKIPPKAMIVSVFLPLGPLGQGGFGAIRLGKAAQTIFPQTNTLEELSGPVFYSMGFLVGLILWSFGLVWLFFASASIARCKKFPFNIGWWGFLFPIGAYASCTCQIGAELPSAFFRILGTIITLCVVVLWIAIGVGTLKGVITGTIFHAPCLADLRSKEKEQDIIKVV
ncbi:voltage-dependent anion channel [Aspergillus granulosus]|uniref:Voltage-dependent anion channel n=1 Tax=Aspergillus granulosus TaxID=176169 RepID=A0ABR4H9J8_9EURO